MAAARITEAREPEERRGKSKRQSQSKTPLRNVREGAEEKASACERETERSQDGAVPSGVVKLSQLMSQFRASLRMQHGGEKANDWFRSNLTPHTIASGQLSNSSLFFDTERRMKAYIVGSESEFHEASGFHQLRLSMEQVADVFRRLAQHAGVSRTAMEAAWDSRWEVRTEEILGLVEVRLTEEQQARYWAGRGEVKHLRVALKRPLDPSSTITHSLPTPSPSIESSPEPVSTRKKARPASRLARLPSPFLPLRVASPSLPLTPTASSSSTPPHSAQTGAPLPEAISAALLAAQKAQDLKDAASISRIAKELEMLRVVYNTRIGKATFLAIDFETYEMQHDLITEAGWASVSLDRSEDGVEERRETQHAVVKENARFRNRRFAPDARDHFDYGTSLTFPEDTLSSLLHALVDAYSSSSPLFILFHDSRADIRTLVQLGFEKSLFSRLGEHYNNQDSGVFVVDTQQLFQGWSGQRRQFKLSKCCDDFNVPTLRPHNAGNDAHYTLGLFERLMDRERRPGSAPAE